MKNIADMQIVQIEVTNVCDKSCSNCTRFCGHFRTEDLYFVDPAYFEKAVITLKNYGGIVGMIGGEPTLHPQFPELCRIFAKHLPDKNRRGLWSNCGTSFSEHSGIIEETFGFFNLNNHHDHEIMHTPILVASEDLISDGRLSESHWHELTDTCWVQMTWSATVTPKGAYFCEVAGMLDYLFKENIGWNIDEQPYWWTKTVADYSAQREWACRKCGCQLPLQPRRSNEVVDDLTASNLKRLQHYGSPKIRQGLYREFCGQLDSSQVRNVEWYWNRESPSLLRRMVRKVIRMLSLFR